MFLTGCIRLELITDYGNAGFEIGKNNSGFFYTFDTKKLTDKHKSENNK